MPIYNEKLMNNIQAFSQTLTLDQLEDFLDIIDVLNAKLIISNQDTEKAYDLYLKSLDVTCGEKMDAITSKRNIPTHSIQNNVIPFKH